MFQFRKISTKLGIVYSCLFMAVMLVISAVTYQVVTRQAQQIVSEGMVASGSVFTHLFVDRAARIQADASLQVKDFGFRSAVASGDRPTIRSALTTLGDRLHIEAIGFVDIDGVSRGQVGNALPLAALSTLISEAYDTPDIVSDPGVVFIDEAPVLVGITPVRAPDIIGWVVFGDFIDATDIADLESLAPIRLRASINRSDNFAGGSKELAIINGDFSLTQEVPSLLPGEHAILTLTYPLAAALEPYYVLLATMAFLVLLGVAAVSAASWGLARRLTRPISALAEATQQVRRGEVATVSVDTDDELARLAVDFNHMSSEVRERENIIRQSARIDSQTNYPNRLAMEERLAIADESNKCVFVASIKIQRYAEIRSAIGFDAAGTLVKSVAEKLSAHSDVSFLSVVSDGLISTLICATDEDAARAIVHSLIELVQTTFLVDGSYIDIMVKAGASDMPPAQSPATAIKQSIIAVEQAAAGHSDFQFFDHARYEETRNNLSLMGDLVQALESNIVTVAYQPKYDLRTRLPIGVEALVRWKDPVRGQVFPDIFIPLAEETGHIEALTHYVLEKSLEAQATLKQHGYDLCMSINLSGRLVGNDRFVDAAAPLLEKRCGEVCFEITETAVIEDPERGIAGIEAFANDGIQISIDDYGSGLSSLAYLKRIPASELKIDKEFVLNVEQSNRDALLVRSTIDLAHSLGMKVTAEGVETSAAAALLAGMGCDVGQGYGLGRPMPLDALIEFLDAEKSDATGDTSAAV